MAGQFWSYADGEWTEIDPPINWPDGEDWEKVAKAAGYTHADDWGVPRMGQIELYSHESGVRWLVSVCLDSGRIQQIYVEGFPNIIDLLHKLSGIATAQLLSSVAASLDSLILNAAKDGDAELQRRRRT